MTMNINIYYSVLRKPFSGPFNHETTLLFWEMVWQSNCSKIVNEHKGATQSGYIIIIIIFMYIKSIKQNEYSFHLFLYSFFFYLLLHVEVSIVLNLIYIRRFV